MPRSRSYLPYLKRTAPLLLLLVVTLFRITSWASTTETVNYTYDDDNQIVKAEFVNYTATVDYVYDNAGNRDYKTTASADTDPPAVSPGT